MSDTMCYVGIATCGCLMAAVVDMPEHREDTAESVSEFIIDGMTVERMTLDSFQKAGGWGHRCGKEDTE